MTVYEAPGRAGSLVEFADRYDHWIGGERAAPVEGGYLENPSPVNGHTFTEVARGTAADVERVLDAAHAAAPAWGRTPVAERALVLNRIADRIEQNLEKISVAYHFHEPLGVVGQIIPRTSSR